MERKLIDYTVAEQVECAANTFGNKTAYYFPASNERLSFIDVKQLSDRVSKAMLALGIRRGSHVGIWNVNCAKYVGLALGATQIGAVFVPLNVNYTGDELLDLCHSSDLDSFFVMEQFNNKNSSEILRGFFAGEKIDEVKFPKLKSIVTCAESSDWQAMGWNEFLAKGLEISDEALAAAKNAVSNQDVYNIQYTSGTTAKPKGARLIQHGVLNKAVSYLEFMHIDADDVVYVPLPLFHCYGNVLTMLGTLIQGNCTIYPPGFSVSQALPVLINEKCTCFMGVASMFNLLMSHPSFSSSELHIKKAGVGGSFCPLALAEQIQEKFGIETLTIGYGLSEACALVTISDIYDPAFSRLNSVGRPLPGLEVSLFNPATQQISQELNEGEVVIRGLGVMIDYYNDPENTQKAIDENGWLHTGDLGSFDEYGCLHIVGRIKDIIIRGGENISASEIEQAVMEVDGVRDCQCVGAPDDLFGEQIAAFIVMQDGLAFNPDEIRAALDGKIAKYKIPHYMFPIDVMPINASGKVLKTELRDRVKRILNKE